MRCFHARAALSADIDGEGGQLDDLVVAHFDGCEGCREWRDLAHRLTRTARLGAALPAAGLSDHIVSAVKDDVRQRRIRRYWIAVFAGVALAGFVQVAVTVPLLLLARSGSDGSGRVLGAIEASIGAAFFVGALVVLWRTRDGSTLHVVDVDPSARPDTEHVARGRVAS